MNKQTGFTYIRCLALLALGILAGCGHDGAVGEGQLPPDPPGGDRTETQSPPAGLSYSDVSGIPGQAIAADIPSSSGGPIEKYSIAPDLPPGLSLNAATGVISGTPLAASDSQTYTVTGTNTAGSVQATLKIEIRAPLLPPSDLSYANATATYALGQAIEANVPSSSGGAISNYSISPALPAGLTLDEKSGAITGTPSAVSDPQTYTIKGLNTAGFTDATVQIEVHAPLPPPANLSYSSLTSKYVQGLAITPNVPTSSGGAVATYYVSPALPPGLTLDKVTGVISGTPIVVAGAAQFTVTASNSAGDATAVLTIAVVDQAPTALTYDDVAPMYAQYGVMTPNNPRNTGGRIANYSVSPALPAGMSLNAVSGVISGSPTVEVKASYVVTGTNGSGSTKVTLQVTVKFPAAPVFTVGDSIRVPIRGNDAYEINDSVFPWLPNSNKDGYLAFWGDASVRRYVGTSFDDMKPLSNGDVNGKVAITYAPGVDQSWDVDGRWMLTATRLPDGSLAAFVHGENHRFADGVKGKEWNSTGLLTSADDGVTWVDQGAVVAEQKPLKAANGGVNASEVIWDEVHQRWLGYSGGTPFISTDPYAMPGTWYGYYNGAFTQHINPQGPKPALSSAPGLAGKGVTWGGLTYNSYLKLYFLTWLPNGEYKKINVAYSPDGVNWKVLDKGIFTEVSPYSVSYAFIVGDTDTLSGQDCYLVYMRDPPSVTGKKKDMVRRPIHFQ